MKNAYINYKTSTVAHLLHPSDEESILTSLRTPAKFRGGGGAKIVMSAICHEADWEQVAIILEPVPDIDSPMNMTELISFYKLFDFVEHPTRPGLLIRQPNSDEV